MGEVAKMPAAEGKPLTALDIQSQVNTIQHVMKQVMKEGVHFGIIPGTKAPSLYKPGAEKIMATFRLSAEPEVTDLSTPDQIRYLVKVRLTSPSGVNVGAGIGECSSNEEKYKWRSSVCQEEFDDAEPARKREKWCKGKYDQRTRSPGKAYKVQQIRTEPADLANTILKMAKKRALIDAVLTATAASDCFTQDVEDLPPEYLDASSDEPIVVISEEEAAAIKKRLQDTDSNVKKFCDVLGIENIDSMPAALIAKANAMLAAKEQKNANS
jgi:hypothetical protein